jgi:hypothetical protein
LRWFKTGTLATNPRENMMASHMSRPDGKLSAGGRTEAARGSGFTLSEPLGALYAYIEQDRSKRTSGLRVKEARRLAGLTGEKAIIDLLNQPNLPRDEDLPDEQYVLFSDVREDVMALIVAMQRSEA